MSSKTAHSALSATTKMRRQTGRKNADWTLKSLDIGCLLFDMGPIVSFVALKFVVQTDYSRLVLYSLNPSN